MKKKKINCLTALTVVMRRFLIKDYDTLLAYERLN